LPKYAWFLENAEGHAWPVAMQKPNDFGLFDMLGNAFEWCDDSYDNYAVANQTDILGDLGTTTDVRDKVSRVLRGGSFFNQASDVRSAYRNFFVPTLRLDYLGFRMARTCPSAP
jgi:formylglycine-generating enzyme required for sulfatase activity